MKQEQDSIDRKRLNARVAYFEKKKGMSHEDAVKRAKESKPRAEREELPEGEVSPWKARQLEKKAREEATKAHPLELGKCPFCGAEYFRRLGDNYDPIKMDHCVPCQARFYYYKGVKQ